MFSRTSACSDNTVAVDKRGTGDGEEFFNSFAGINIYPYFCIGFDTRYYADTR